MLWCMMQCMWHQCLWHECDECACKLMSYLAEDRWILDGWKIKESWLLPGKINPWLLLWRARVFNCWKWEVLGPLLGESEAWVVCQTTGVFLFWGDLCRISWRWVRVKLHRVFEHFWHSNAPSGDVDNFLACYRCWSTIGRPQMFSWLVTGVDLEFFRRALAGYRSRVWK